MSLKSRFTVAIRLLNRLSRDLLNFPRGEREYENHMAEAEKYLASAALELRHATEALIKGK